MLVLALVSLLGMVGVYYAYESFGDIGLGALQDRLRGNSGESAGHGGPLAFGGSSPSGGGGGRTEGEGTVAASPEAFYPFATKLTDARDRQIEAVVFGRSQDTVYFFRLADRERFSYPIDALRFDSQQNLRERPEGLVGSWDFAERDLLPIINDTEEIAYLERKIAELETEIRNPRRSGTEVKALAAERIERIREVQRLRARIAESQAGL